MIVGGLIVPGLPHPLLAPEKSPAWTAIREGFERAREALHALQPELLVLYSTQWTSVIGHQIQVDPEPEWTLVDQDWHALGTIPYKLKMDASFGESWRIAAEKRGLHARTIHYPGFPIDTGSVVALKLLNPDNRIPASIVSSNMYADRAETLVLGKSAADAVNSHGKRTVAIAVTGLSGRLFPHAIDPTRDEISSPKDDEWNRKILEILSEGRLEDTSQLARTFSQQANADQKFKAIWWLSALMGQHNRYTGKVYTYQPLWGTGAAVVSLLPSSASSGDLEFDEEDVEVFRGDRAVLAAASTEGKAPPKEVPTKVESARAPVPVGPYPHARREGEWIYVSGMGPRQPSTNLIPGGPVRDAAGQPLPYDIAAQTRATIENIRSVLEDAGASLQDVVDVSCYLIDMARDFQTFNEVYREYFASIGATRTTIEVRALPTPIAVELKVVARVKG